MSETIDDELQRRLTRWLEEGAALYATGLAGHGMALRRVYDPMIISAHLPTVPVFGLDVRRRFPIGARVQTTEPGERFRNKRHGTKRRTGTIVGYSARGTGVRVHLDGNKRPRAHCERADYWEVIDVPSARR